MKNEPSIKKKIELTTDDLIALDLLNKAQIQYEEYEEINQLSNVLNFEQPTYVEQRNINHPLTIQFNS